MPPVPVLPSDIPVLVTERLILRAHRREEFGAYVAFWRDPEVTRFIGGRPYTEEETWARFLRYAGLWAHLGYGYWAIEEKASARLVGEIGFADFGRAIDPPIRDFPEHGWALSPAVHGRGYATEALAATLIWAEAHLEAERTVALIDATNVPSWKLAVRAGYRQDRIAAYRGDEVTIFARPLARIRPISSSS